MKSETFLNIWKLSFVYEFVNVREKNFNLPQILENEEMRVLSA